MCENITWHENGFFLRSQVYLNHPSILTLSIFALILDKCKQRSKDLGIHFYNKFQRRSEYQHVFITNSWSSTTEIKNFHHFSVNWKIAYYPLIFPTGQNGNTIKKKKKVYKLSLFARCGLQNQLYSPQVCLSITE